MANDHFTGEKREKIIVRTGVIGIAANVLLAAFKAVIGVASHSIAVTMDAVNNISDAASSLITIVGTKLAAKDPDKKHPFGYGRIEYLTAMIIALLVLYAGITSLAESVKKIIAPSTPDYSATALVIIAVAVVVKVVLGRYVKAKGIMTHSDSLINSGQDAVLDAVISASTLAAALIFIATGISLEAWLAAVISLVIIKSGFDMLKETLSRVLGQRAEGDLAAAIKKTALSFPEVHGVYDLVLNDYGPDRYNGSFHMEVDDTLAAEAIDHLERDIANEIYARHGVIITAIGIYAVNTVDPEVQAIREDISDIVLGFDHVLQIHGFAADLPQKTIRFDVVIDFDAADRRGHCATIHSAVAAKYPEYTIEIILDSDNN